MATDTEDDLQDKIPAAALKLAKVAQNSTTTSPQDLARARLQAMRRLLGETEKLLVEWKGKPGFTFWRR